MDSVLRTGHHIQSENSWLPADRLGLLHWWSSVFLTRFQAMLLVWGLLFENLCPGGAPKAPVWKALHSEGRGIVPESTEVETYYVLEGGHGDSWTEILWNYSQGCPKCPETMSGVRGRSTNSEQEDSVLLKCIWTGAVQVNSLSSISILSSGFYLLSREDSVSLQVSSGD